MHPADAFDPDVMLCAQCHGELRGVAAHALIPPRCALCGEPPLLQERYRLRRVLGAGASGTTFLAERLDRPAAASEAASEASSHNLVALKELSVRAIHSLKALELFEREAATTRALHHPQIPGYVEHFHRAEGKQVSLYLAQEFIQGQTLEQELASTRFDERAAIALLRQILPVLDYLHGLSPPVIHRDIKTRNLMRRAADGQLVLIDFGAVREVVQDPALGGSTVAGTFGYMAPEQFAGVAVPATDLYALGVTVIAALSRRNPQELLDAHHILQWRSSVKVSPGFEAILLSLLEPDYKRRVSSAREVLARLDALERAGASPASSPAASLASSPAPRQALDLAWPTGGGQGGLGAWLDDQEHGRHLAKWIHLRFTRQNSGAALDKMGLDRLRAAADQACVDLRHAAEVQINLPFITATASGPVHLQMTVTRADLQAALREQADAHTPAAMRSPDQPQLPAVFAPQDVARQAPSQTRGLVLVVVVLMAFTTMLFCMGFLVMW